MMHRRTLEDDGRGLNEPLDDESIHQCDYRNPWDCRKTLHSHMDKTIHSVIKWRCPLITE